MGTSGIDGEEEANSPAAILAVSSSTQRKWAPIVMLGPILPSMLAAVTIVLGEAIVKVRYSSSTDQPRHLWACVCVAGGTLHTTRWA